MSIKTLIAIIINSLIVFAVSILSITSYNQFSKVLNNRTLLQLNSIKTLKKNQIENLINNEWNSFLTSEKKEQTLNDFNLKIPKNIIKSSGVYDFTPYHKKGITTIGLVSIENNEYKFAIIDYNKIKSILEERTGMGESGESYLVGSDFTMRSESRFLKDRVPSTIKVNTIGVKKAALENDGKGIFNDYRGINVYSVYSLITISNLKLILLSEINEDEVTIPLNNLKIKLLELTITIIGISILLSFFLIKIITNPINNMKDSLKIMANGDYTKTIEFTKISDEIKEMFNALANLKKSLQGAVDFSDELGKMNLNTTHIPKSDNDLLGNSLIVMKNRLLEFRNKEKRNRILTKKLLLDGLEEERKRLSRELHDGIGPLLTTLKFYIENRLENSDKKKEMKEIVDTTISEIRLMSSALRPTSIDDFGIGPTLTNYVKSIENSINIDIKFEDSTKVLNSKISNNQGTNIFRIVQELVNNTIKHTEAKNITITLSEFDNFVSLFYFDNGKGFDLDKVNLGFGITNIYERVEIHEGSIQIESNNKKTTFEIEIPLTK